MYPAGFEYFAPASLEEALSVLERFGDEAKVLAGGQSLIPLMKLRFASPRAIVDLNRIEGLDGLYEDDGMLNAGALVRHKTCERSELLKRRYDVLADAAPQISDPIVRNLGTMAGSLAHADPQGDWGSALLAAGARVQARGPGGTRTIPLDEFFLGPFTTALEPTEIVAWRHTRTPSSPPPAEAVDPVCGKTVSLAGAGTHVHEGTTFAFCCADCRARFEADPARFVAAGAP